MRYLMPTLLLALVAGSVHAGDVVSYGKPLPAGPSMALSAAIADFDARANKPGRFKGRIAEVCQAEGCWMMLEDEGRVARVKFGDHAFLIPKDSSGRAEVHGVLSRKHLTPEQVAHFREEGKGLEVAPVEYHVLADGMTLERSP